MEISANLIPQGFFVASDLADRCLIVGEVDGTIWGDAITDPLVDVIITLREDAGIVDEDAREEPECHGHPGGGRHSAQCFGHDVP